MGRGRRGWQVSAQAYGKGWDYGTTPVSGPTTGVRPVKAAAAAGECVCPPGRDRAGGDHGPAEIARGGRRRVPEHEGLPGGDPPGPPRRPGGDVRGACS